jgi:hypothetical protein
MEEDEEGEEEEQDDDDHHDSMADEDMGFGDQDAWLVD